MMKIYTIIFSLIFSITSLVYGNCPDNRVSDGLVALYGFTAGSGSTVYDVSGYGIPENLTIEDPSNTSWLSSCGLSINSSTIIESSTSNSKVVSAMMATNEITIEAWVQPANTTQDGPARIATISQNTSLRNATLGQEDGAVEARLRTTDVNNNGMPSAETGNNVLTTALQHIVYTRDVAGNERIYVNGVVVDSDTRTGDFSNWDSTYKLALANELSGSRTWLGTYYLIAFYNKALSQTEVNTNYGEGYCCGSSQNITSDWLYSCEDGTGNYVETVGLGIKNSIPATMNFTDKNSIDQIVVEVVYKGGNPGSSVEIEDEEGNTYTANRERPAGTSSSVYMYRFYLPATARITYSEANNDDDAQSIIAHIFREGVSQKTQLGKFVYISGVRDVQTIDFTIPAGTVARDIDVKLPISELTDDCRILNITATAGNVSNTITIDGPNAAYGTCCLDMITIPLPDVAASTTDLTVSIESPIGSGCNNGQSYVLIGTVSVDIACDPAALPVELDYFEAQLQRNNTVQLNWQTASELDNDYFSVERSVDAKHWESIAWLSGMGTTDATTRYELVDEKPMPGKSYYRLKQVDFDGQFEYSDIEVIENESFDVVEVYPIPASDVIYVSGLAIENSTNVSLYNAMGQRTDVKFSTSNGNQLKMDISQFPSGTYYLLISNKEERISRKVIIK